MDLLTQLKEAAAKARAKADALETAVKALEGVDMDTPLPGPTKPLFVAVQPPVVSLPAMPPIANPVVGLTITSPGRSSAAPSNNATPSIARLAAKAQRIADNKGRR